MMVRSVFWGVGKGDWFVHIHQVLRAPFVVIACILLDHNLCFANHDFLYIGKKNICKE